MTKNSLLAARERDQTDYARRWWILGLVGIAQLMIVLDATVVTIALPSAQRSLGFSAGDRQWIVTAYALAFGSLLLIGGRLTDRLGRKWTFVTGLAGFAVASAVGGAATGFAELVVARAVQGGFAALLAPAGLALLTKTFTRASERATAFGVYGAIGGAGAAVGLLLGGVLTEYASWRWTMFINIFFAGAALVGGLFLVRHDPAEHRPKLDWAGTLTVSAGLFSLVYGFSHAETAGWANGVTIAFLITAGILLGAFAVIQRRAAHPLMPPHVLFERNRGGAFLAMFATAAGMFAVFLFLTYYMQLSLGYSAVRTGLAFLPLVVGLIVGAAVASSRRGSTVAPRIILPTALLLAAVAMFMLTRLGAHSGYATSLLPALVLVGLAMGPIFAVGTNVSTHGVSGEDGGVAAALVSTMQQVGGSVGTALLNTLAASALATYLSSHVAQANASSLAAVHSYTTAFWWAAGIFAGAAAMTALILRSGVQRSESDAGQPYQLDEAPLTLEAAIA
jgi:EmrB/QacA subfamily drug resistance transporter